MVFGKKKNAKQKTPITNDIILEDNYLKMAVAHLLLNQIYRHGIHLGYLHYMHRGESSIVKTITQSLFQGLLPITI